MEGLQCQKVTKDFGTHSVLSGIDLTVQQGSLTAILGASGSGKTTLLRLIMGFARLNSGRITVGNQVVAEAPHAHVRPEARAIGYVAQEGALFPHLTIGENVGYGLRRDQRKKSPRITECLELVGLSSAFEHRPVHEISGGEQRRVALARALAPRPRMVLLDEPFSGLDASLRVETRNAVLAALHNEDATTILVTHDQAEALSMGQQVAVLRDGQLAQTADPYDLYWQPTSLDVAKFIGDAVVLPGTQRHRSVECIFGKLETSNESVDGDVLVVIRPEQIFATSSASNHDGAKAVVTGRTFLGADAVLQMSMSQGEQTYLVSSRTRSLGAPSPGEKVVVRVTGSVVTFGSTEVSSSSSSDG